MRRVLLLLAVCLCAAAPARADDFYLKDGDRVVFYGDSITEQREYTARVEEFVLSRFPSWHVTFVHAGIGGDTVNGGWAGAIDERIDRDVLPFKPTVVTIMLGMNDGGYKPFDQPTFDTYRAGYRHILERVTKGLPGVRLTLIQPSPFDDVSRSIGFDGGYNAVLRRYGDLVADLAKEFGATVVDFNTPVVRGLERVNAANTQLAHQILPDRVHPGPAGHWLMAEALLRAWHAPAVVSRVTIDAAAGTLVSAEHTGITALSIAGGLPTWTALDASLPLPVSYSDATMELVRAAGGDVDGLNVQQLRVTGLAAGRYHLKIDDDVIKDVLTEGELAAGIDLSHFDTAMSWQAMGVRWSGTEKNLVHAQRTQVLVRGKTAPAFLATAKALDALEAAVEHDRDPGRQPKPHRMAIVRDEPAATR